MKKAISDYNFEEGELLLINKPLTWTSFDVVNKIRYALKIKKVGHAGTLDPLATGLLIIATGKFTKKLNDIQGLDKSYTGIFEIGKTTPSFDLETEFENPIKTEHITKDDILETARLMTGWQDQIPPIYSAIKKDGIRAYTLARKGEQPELNSRNINISKFDILDIDGTDIHFDIHCSKGTYIRSIARDFGVNLKTGAYLKKLTRTSIGEYSLDDAWELDQFVEDLKNR